jgi:hypothetical protein
MHSPYISTHRKASRDSEPDVGVSALLWHFRFELVNNR